jgi:hypothetical protein
MELAIMTITLDLPPDIEQGLRAQAQAQGVSLTDFVGQIVERQAHLANSVTASEHVPAKNLYELFAPIRGLLTDEEIDSLFSRNPSPGRPVDLA